MDHDDKAAIDGLFDRLRQAEGATGPRDAEAEAHIGAMVARQPAAPYYMAQAVLVQERALDALKARVDELERDLASRPAGGGGFLSCLFGPSKAAGSTPMAPRRDPLAGSMRQFQQAPRGGFLSGALQTAAGVAGGVLLGNMIAGMFASEAQAAAAPEPQPEPQPQPQPEPQAESAGSDFSFGDDDEF
ncbi:MAG: DUF2076 domain-containing protein [Alphaproteobacteria bacterium]|nr:DUF2076 domain-containing protein [Alphaproteobacteria bacterium]